MATRFGWEKAQALVAKGWTIKQEKEDMVQNLRFGDPIMVDNVTGKEYDPYVAEEIQKTREEAKREDYC